MKISLILKYLSVLLLVCFNSYAYASTRSEIERMVIEESENSRVPAALALAVAKVESDFNERALSSAGARGVMQIMPMTAKNVFGVSPVELWDPRLNIQLGLDYLEQLHDLYGGNWELALSHYNGGSLNKKGAYATPHGYTRKYVSKVNGLWQHYENQSNMWREDKKSYSGYVAARTRTKWIGLQDIADNIVNSHDNYDERWKSSSQSNKGYKTILQVENRNDSLKERLLRARGSLDDFSPTVHWTAG